MAWIVLGIQGVELPTTVRATAKGPATNLPLQITFRNMAPSQAIEAAIEEKAGKLCAFYDGITSCRVTVETPHRRHRKGKLYHVRIDLTLPGGKIVVRHEPKRLTVKAPRLDTEPNMDLEETHEPGKYAAHEDAYVAIRDAFDAARRRLQDYARRQSGAIKLHSPPTHGRVTKLFVPEGFGFIETADGREVYFHKNSVLDAGFVNLKVGTAVYFAEEEGNKGYQASTVRLAGKHRLL